MTGADLQLGVLLRPGLPGVYELSSEQVGIVQLWQIPDCSVKDFLFQDFSTLLGFLCV